MGKGKLNYVFVRWEMVLIASLACAFLAILVGTPSAIAQQPQTGFEQRGSESWTTQEEEEKFLTAVEQASNRVAVDEIGETAEGRPLNLVRIGNPEPPTIQQSAQQPTVLFVCSQHGDEPAGREACLTLLRDLAFTSDPELTQQLSETSVLFIPNANPDGRAADTRENSQNIDINRDHLEYVSAEGRAIGEVMRTARPDIVHDLHEYSSDSELYDSELLTLWPRNRNVDDRVQGLSESLSRNYATEGAQAEGTSAGVYGNYTLDEEPVAQVAGDGDERILRNATGLRHSLGLLVESDKDPNPRNPEESDSKVALQERRVETHIQAALDTMRFLRERGGEISAATEEAPERKATEGAERGAPVAFDGADNNLPSPEEIAYPPPCAYQLTEQQAERGRDLFELHRIQTQQRGANVLVPMAQPAEPVIPLLFDSRALYGGPVEGRPLDDEGEFIDTEEETDEEEQKAELASCDQFEPEAGTLETEDEPEIGLPETGGPAFLPLAGTLVVASLGGLLLKRYLS